jgi:hypothetical protein
MKLLPQFKLSSVLRRATFPTFNKVDEEVAF